MTVFLPLQFLTFGVIGCKLPTQMSVESLPGKEKSERQRWEYKFLERSRGMKRSWDGTIHTLEWSKDIPSTVEALGEEGWELMAVVPRSSILIGIVGAGFTSDELWVFKRPK